MSLVARLRRRGLASRLAAWVGMLAVVLQLGVPILHDPMAPLVGVAICHAGGGGPAAPSDKKPGPCPICLGLQGTVAALIPPHPAMIALEAAPTSQSVPPGRVAAPRGHDPGSPSQPRAPPVSA